jgi:hypothetical protein
MRRVVALLLLAVAALAPHPARALPVDLCLALVGLGGCATASTAAVDETRQTTVVRTHTTVSTELVARMLNGPVLSDQILGVAFGAPAVSALIAADEGMLALAGATSFQGPTFAHTITSDSFTTTEQTTTTSAQVVGSHTFAGPTSIRFGDFGTCQSFVLDAGGYPFVSDCDGTPYLRDLVSGQSVTDTLTLTLVASFITTTIDDDHRITQVYDLVGIPAEVVALPEPGSLILFAAALAGLACLAGWVSSGGAREPAR